MQVFCRLRNFFLACLVLMRRVKSACSVIIIISETFPSRQPELYPTTAHDIRLARGPKSHHPLLICTLSFFCFHFDISLPSP
jgi:hypothetical protein